MKRQVYSKLFILTVLAIFFIGCSGRDLTVSVEGMNTIQLPPPETKGGKPLMEALKERKSSRNFSEKKLSEQVLSNLLWAAFGLNRPSKNLRTAPSAVNWQETDIYVALEEGIYMYQYKEHTLRPVAKGDFRSITGSMLQPFVKKAPVNLIYVADYTKIGITGFAVSDEEKTMYTSAHSGFIGQNVYLYCASEGLSTVVRGMIDRDSLKKVLSLTDKQKIILAQTVGYPGEKNTSKELIDLSGVQDGAYDGSYKTDTFTYELRVFVKAKKIEKIEVLSFQKNKYDTAVKEIADRVIKTGSLEVDTVTGATQSSEAAINAIRDSLIKAGKNKD